MATGYVGNHDNRTELVILVAGNCTSCSTQVAGINCYLTLAAGLNLRL